MTPDAAALLEILTNGKPHREVYLGGHFCDRWFVTYGGGEVQPESVRELVKGGYIRSVYNDCPNDCYHVGRTIDVQRTVAERKKYRRGKDAPVIYVEDSGAVLTPLRGLPSLTGLAVRPSH